MKLSNKSLDFFTNTHHNRQLKNINIFKKFIIFKVSFKISDHENNLVWNKIKENITEKLICQKIIKSNVRKISIMGW